MSEIQRICPSCGNSASLSSRYCPACGEDSQANFALTEQRSLPAAIGRAALPVLAGAATLALRAGWRLLNDRLSAPAQPPTPHRPQTGIEPQQTVSHRIRIRSAWVVGDGQGNVRQGSSEHIIDLE